MRILLFSFYNTPLCGKINKRTYRDLSAECMLYCIPTAVKYWHSASTATVDPFQLFPFSFRIAVINLSLKKKKKKNSIIHGVTESKYVDF